MSEPEKKEPEKKEEAPKEEAPKEEVKKSEEANNLANDVANLKVKEEEQRPGSTSPAPPSGGGAGTGSFIASFKAFSKFGDTKSDGKHITLSQSDKWMKQAKVIDGKKITTTDTGIFFKKQKSMKLGIEQYKAFLDDLAKSKKVEVSEIKSKMANCGPPGVSNATVPGKAASAVDRLTDVSKYTGSHKQRFDQSGKGRGIAGRKDLPDQSGYVQGYQNKDTYKAP